MVPVVWAVKTVGQEQPGGAGIGSADMSRAGHDDIWWIGVCSCEDILDQAATSSQILHHGKRVEAMVFGLANSTENLETAKDGSPPGAQRMICCARP